MEEKKAYYFTDEERSYIFERLVRREEELQEENNLQKNAEEFSMIHVLYHELEKEMGERAK